MTDPDYSSLDREALLRLLKIRDRQALRSREYWVRAAEKALAGDPRELQNRVALAKEPYIDVVLSA